MSQICINCDNKFVPSAGGHIEIEVAAETVVKLNFCFMPDCTNAALYKSRILIEEVRKQGYEKIDPELREAKGGSGAVSKLVPFPRRNPGDGLA